MIRPDVALKSASALGREWWIRSRSIEENYDYSIADRSLRELIFGVGKVG
jgi:hypothetical protein